MIETPRLPEDRDTAEQSQAAEQSEEANARAEANAQVEEQVEQAVPTLGDIGSLED
jgi:hypothetical protein